MRISICGLGFTYGGKPVLKDISFSAEAGECVALLGENGAGKSTLLQCIGGILCNYHGTVNCDEVNTKTLKRTELARQIAYVPQLQSVSVNTVFEEVLTGRIPHLVRGVSEKDLSVTQKILTRVGLSRVAQRKTNELSGGELQRVAIARALTQEPKLLLADEPTANLDMKCQTHVARLLRELAKEEGVTTIAALHDLNFALSFADKFVFLKDGGIYAVGGKEVITAETIKAVYGADVRLLDIDGQIAVLPY